MVAQGAVKEYRHGDTWTAEILKSEGVCANAHEWNVDLACRMANVTSGRQVDPAADRRRSGMMTLRDSMLKDTGHLASVQRILDSIQAWSDGGKQQMLSSDPRRSWRLTLPLTSRGHHPLASGRHQGFHEGLAVEAGRVLAMWRREELLKCEMGDDQRLGEDQKDERWKRWMSWG